MRRLPSANPLEGVANTSVTGCYNILTEGRADTPSLGSLGPRWSDWKSLDAIECFLEGGPAGRLKQAESRSYYGADDRLRVLQKLDIRRTDWSNHERAGLWEEYRYDPLGRRVLVRTRTDGGLCDYDAWGCTPSTTTFVWAGDQLLWELKEASGTYASAAGGNVAYFHAGGIDRPLVITKNGESIVPHQNWRGQFARGTYADGAKAGQRSDCTSYPASGCTPIQWPGERTTARHELEPDNNIQNWFGSLVDDMRDATGQMYRRNRYYDPHTGQFTQPDPIGLAGGLNAYGFADGDPVSYSDPYGLSVEGGCPPICNETNPRHLKLEVQRAHDATAIDAAVGGAILLGISAPALLPALRNAFGARGAVQVFRTMREARGILSSSGMSTLRDAAARNVSAEVQIGGRTIVYEPRLRDSGMTLFGENGFVLGRNAFSSSGELTRTLLHELHRLSTSARAGASAASAASETASAWRFAERAYNLGNLLGLW